MDDIEVGDPNFDQRYIIQGADPNAIRRILTPKIREAIDHLRYMTHYADVNIQAMRGRLLIRIRGYLRDKERLEQFIFFGLRVYDEVLLVAGAGIRFVAPVPAEGKEKAICQICGEPIASDSVLCIRCKTPHHRDCWHYAQQCSTYGCGGKRYTCEVGKK
jgi:hypothetical protein